jgi:hypothetical protein
LTSRLDKPKEIAHLTVERPSFSTQAFCTCISPHLRDVPYLEVHLQDLFLHRPLQALSVLFPSSEVPVKTNTPKKKSVPKLEQHAKVEIITKDTALTSLIFDRILSIA